MVTEAELVSLVHVLAAMTFLCGAFIQSLPIPMRSLKSQAPSLQWDAVLTEIAIGTVYSVRLLADWIQSMIASSLAIPVEPGTAYAVIMAQLIAIDGAIMLLITTVNATVVFAPLAELLARMLGSSAGWVTNTIILWTMLQIVILEISKLWLLFWTLGIVFFAIPFKLGRRLGAYLMSISIVSAISLPLLPSIALWLEAQIGYQNSLTQLESFVADILKDPLNVATALNVAAPALLLSIIGNLLAAVIIGLMVFPVSFLFMMSLVARSVASLIMGYGTPASFNIGSHDFLR
ncbi:MAG: hypothetical protein HYY22_09100 [Thaumarchaeota archaeon]|nr:hypothetical protein [Nitrososphaerota archaeon]